MKSELQKRSISSLFLMSLVFLSALVNTNGQKYNIFETKNYILLKHVLKDLLHHYSNEATKNEGLHLNEI